MSTDIHVIHQHGRKRLRTDIGEPVHEHHLARRAIHPPCPEDFRFAALRHADDHASDHFLAVLRPVMRDDLGLGRGHRAMKRIFAATRPGDRLGMPDMIGAAGEKKTTDGMQDARVAVIGHGPARRELDPLHPAGADIERRRQVELQVGTRPNVKLHRIPRSRIRSRT
jgi:hypothetical protein